MRPSRPYFAIFAGGQKKSYRPQKPAGITAGQAECHGENSGDIEHMPRQGRFVSAFGQVTIWPNGDGRHPIGDRPHGLQGEILR